MRLTALIAVLPTAATLMAALPAHAQDQDVSAPAMRRMTGAFGPYAMNREASGTAWQPEMNPDEGVMVHTSGWMLMGHTLLNGVYDTQGGPRGGDKAYVAGMVMGMAQHPAGNGTLGFRAMVSPDPLMGKRGYPLLLASGETADGTTPLIDRQHPHDLFMELSASYSQPLKAKTSAFVYAGLPGEPAFGPPAFMHRLSIMDSPEAPIAHHWLDSTHITFGVVTAGLVLDDWKIEASRFHGREPDENRYDIETGQLDSTAVRLAWNPGKTVSLQASWADIKSPEALEPDEDQARWSASAIVTRPVGIEGYWSTTAAWGRRTGHHGDWLDAYVLESALKPDGPWTIFGRAERVENDELAAVAKTPAVAKASIGVIRDFRVGRQARFGLGALYARTFLPADLKRSYGGEPGGGMVFIRLKVG